MDLEKTIPRVIFKFIEQAFDLEDPQNAKQRLREAQIKEDYERQLALTHLRASLNKTKINMTTSLRKFPGLPQESRERANAALNFIEMVRGAVEQVEFEGQVQGNLSRVNDALESANAFLIKLSGAANTPRLQLNIENFREGAETLQRNVEVGLKTIMHSTAFEDKPAGAAPDLSKMIAPETAAVAPEARDTTAPDAAALDRLLSKIGIQQ